MTNKASGIEAEAKVAEYLESNGYEIINRNWQTRWCEIDIVAKRDNRIYFVEVKSRKSTFQGSGFDYITPKKLRQMSFAAEMWVNNQDWRGEYQLSAAEVEGSEIAFMENI